MEENFNTVDDGRSPEAAKTTQSEAKVVETEESGAAREADSPNLESPQLIETLEQLQTAASLATARAEKQQIAAQKFTRDVILSLSSLGKMIKDEVDPIKYEQHRVAIFACAFEAIASGHVCFIEHIIDAAFHFSRWNPNCDDPKDNFTRSRIVRVK